MVLEIQCYIYMLCEHARGNGFSVSIKYVDGEELESAHVDFNNKRIVVQWHTVDSLLASLAHEIHHTDQWVSGRLTRQLNRVNMVLESLRQGGTPRPLNVTPYWELEQEANDVADQFMEMIGSSYRLGLYPVEGTVAHKVNQLIR